MKKSKIKHVIRKTLVEHYKPGGMTITADKIWRVVCRRIDILYDREHRKRLLKLNNVGIKGVATIER